MKQEPKTISEKKRIDYIKMMSIKGSHTYIEGEVFIHSLRKYKNLETTSVVGSKSEIRYEVDITFRGKFKAVGPLGYKWYSTTEILNDSKLYSHKRVRASLRKKVFHLIKSKLEILAFDPNQCEIKKLVFC